MSLPLTKRWLHAYEGNLLDAAKVLDLTEDGNIVAIRVAELIERMKGPRKHERRETARAAPVASRVSSVTDDPTVGRADVAPCESLACMPLRIRTRAPAERARRTTEALAR